MKIQSKEKGRKAENNCTKRDERSKTVKELAPTKYEAHVIT